MYWGGAYTKKGHYALLGVRLLLLGRYRSKVDYSWFSLLSWFMVLLIIWWGLIAPQRMGNGNHDKTIPIHPKYNYASVAISTIRLCSTIAAPVYAVPTIFVNEKALSRSSSTSTGVPAGRISPAGPANGAGVPSA